MNDILQYGNWKILGPGSKSGYVLAECQCENHTKKEIKKTKIKTNEAAKECIFCKDKKNSLVGQRFSSLYVIKKNIEKSTSKRTYYDCLCDCGNSITVRRDHLLDGHVQSCGCLSKKLFTKNLLGKVFNDWEVIEQVSPPIIDLYSGSWWKLKCRKCGEEKILKGIHITVDRCGFCSSNIRTKGEQTIYNILTTNNIYFIEQFSFTDLKNILPLRFDFYIPSMKCAIEYQGQQHYEPINYFGGQESFLHQKENDKLKEEYCKSHGIYLVQIPFYIELNKITIQDLLPNSRFQKSEVIF